MKNKHNCVVCNTLVYSNNDLEFHYCKNCGTRYDQLNKTILTRHNWNLDEFAKNYNKKKK